MAVKIVAVLATYQLIEYLICGVNLQSSYITYTAFVVISFLPPMTLHFTLKLFDKWKRGWSLIYLPAAAFTIYYAFILPQFSTAKCSIFYAVHNYPHGDLFGLVYYLPILATMILLFRFRNNPVNKKIKASVKILLGALIFTALPVLTAFILKAFELDGLLRAIVSVMCKFAIGYAFALAIFALLNSKDKNARNNS
ncbi:MAG: hypothetical protein K8H86_07485 [Ignavibacteriaceae bacterium]|nr:hypothetical protein [Ignavibacteriaceae bacterium]